jgi:DNA replication protein DnaC
MKLNGMAEAFKDQLLQPDIDDLSFEERFSLLVDRHWTWKEDRRTKRLLSQAKLKINACVEDIDYRAPRGLHKSIVLQLASCDWIRYGQNVIITGPTGVGKTYLACALANRACRMGLSAFYIRIHPDSFPGPCHCQGGWILSQENEQTRQDQGPYHR